MRNVLDGEKKPLSSQIYRDMFSVNLRNLEYYKHNPLKAVVVANGFIAFCIFPLLIIDFFVPISGKSPAIVKKDGDKTKKSSPKKDFKNEVPLCPDNKIKVKNLKFD